jgi:hypothetical protein
MRAHPTVSASTMIAQLRLRVQGWMSQSVVDFLVWRTIDGLVVAKVIGSRMPALCKNRKGWATRDRLVLALSA